MKYIKTTLGVGPWDEISSWKKNIINILGHIIPKANPDFNHQYTNVRLWWLELDSNNIPQRELGFNENNQIIVVAPILNNYGFWTDGSESIEGEKFSLVSKDEFEQAWDSFTAKVNPSTST